MDSLADRPPTPGSPNGHHPATRRNGAPTWAAFGLLACAAGMALGHLVAALTTPAASPVLAVGSTVIDLTPTPMKEWAIRTFGERDKVVLVGSVLAVTLVLAALAGMWARRRFEAGAGLLVGLVSLAAVAALTRPLAEPRDVLPSTTAGIAALVVLATLRHLEQRARPARASAGQHPAPVAVRADPRWSPLPAPPRNHPMAPHLAVGPQQPEVADPHRADRRTVLLTAGVIAALAGTAGWLGRRIEQVRTSIADIVLPRPPTPAAALPTGLEAVFPGISDFRTANADFYRVDVNLTLPVVPLGDWDLRIDGDVDNPFSLTFDELTALPMVERDITLTCVSNEVGGKYVGAARWLGVPLAALLERAGVRAGADQVLSTAADGFTISTPLEVVLDGRDALVAVGMNGRPLPAEHGSPARLVVPGIYGYVGATKWLRRLTVTRFTEASAYWTDRGWDERAPIKVSSRIDTPRPLARVPAGRVPIGGVAWAQHRGIDRVEVRVDGGPWQVAQLGPDAGIDYWRQWFLLWDAAPGRHTLAVRATSSEGEVQTAVRATPYPNGSSGIQEIQVVVE